MLFALAACRVEARNKIFSTATHVLEQNLEDTLFVEDPLFDPTDPTSGTYFPSIKTIIELGLNYDDPALFTDHMGAIVDLSIDYYELENGTWVLRSGVISTLEIDFHADGSASIDRSALVLEGGGQVQVRATARDAGTGAAFPLNLEMKARMEVAHYTELSASAPDSSSLSHTYLADDGTLKIQWSTITGAEYYDLEWAFINDYGPDGTQLDTSEITLPDHFFRNNSTRISIDETGDSLSYEIPLLYEHGYIVYRVRAVGKSAVDGFERFINGPWSESDNQVLTDYYHKFLFEGHITDINWHTSRDYQEGRSGTAISYNDGSLRPRQLVRQMSTTNEAIVSETVYDAEGREAVKIMPVPANDSELTYYPLFNVPQADTTVPYNWRYFDSDPNAGCVAPPGPLSNVSGAANYYSSANSKVDRHHEFLPESNGYPLSRTLYTRDKTGRVSRQGDVGTALQPQSTNSHDVQVFYGKPDQEELDIVFGAEIGSAKHYRKTVKVDPNGQSSINYYNLKGDIIATALTGGVPTNLEALPSFERINYQVDLLQNNNNVKSVSPGTAQKGFSAQRIVSTAGEHVFDYTLSVDPLVVQCEELDALPVDINYCASCVLDLKIGLISSCGDVIINSDTTIDPINCESTTLDNETIVVELPTDEYTLFKYISVNQERMKAYSLEYLRTLDTTCFYSFDDFLSSEYEVIDTTDCEYGCGECLEELEQDFDMTNPPQFGDVRFEEYQDRLENCNLLCGGSGLRCYIGYQGMLGDVSPHGQYGLLLENTPGETAINDDGTDIIISNTEDDISVAIPANSPHPLSVFNVTNQLSLVKEFTSSGRAIVLYSPNWRNPMEPYKNADGSVSYVKSVVLNELSESGVLSRSFDPPILNREPADGETFALVLPQQLKNLSDFVEEWQPSWAEALVYFHPEYPLYLECLQMEDHFKFMEELQAASFDEAIAPGTNGEAYIITDGSLNSDNYRTNVDADAFFSDTELFGNQAQVYKSDFENRIENYIQFDDNPDQYYSLWEWSFAADNCPLNDPELITCDDNAGNCHVGRGVFDQTSWEQYQAHYNALRQPYEMAWQKRQSIAGGFYNGCIGNEDYRVVQYDLFQFYDPRFISFGSWISAFTNFYIFNRNALCSYSNWKLYTDKAPNFPITESVMDGFFTDEEFCVAEDYIEDAYCPEKANYMAEYGRLRHELSIYEDCGQCPVTWYFEQFMNAIAVNPDVDLNDEIRLGCTNVTEIPQYTEFLASAMGFTNNAANGANMFWRNDPNTTQPDDDYFVLNAEIDHDGIQSCQVYLKFQLEDENLGVSVENFDPAEVSHICCMKSVNELDILTSAEYPQDPASSGEVFSFSSGYGDGYINLKGEGFTSCLRLDRCEFPAVCEPTRLSRDLFDLLSAIAFEFKVGGQTKENLLTDVSGFELSSDPYSIFVSDELQQAGITSAWSWKPSSVSATSLNASLVSPDDPNDHYDFVMTAQSAFPANTDFNDIISFSAFRADLSSSDPANNWLVNAKVVTNNGSFEMITLQVSVSASTNLLSELELLKCTEPISVDQ